MSLCWVSELDSLGNQVEDSFGTYLLMYFLLSTVYRSRSIQVSMEVKRGCIEAGRTARLKVPCNVWHYSVSFATVINIMILRVSRSERAYTDHMKSFYVCDLGWGLVTSLRSFLIENKIPIMWYTCTHHSCTHVSSRAQRSYKTWNVQHACVTSRSVV